MTIDFEYIKWLASQGAEVAEKVAPLVARILNLSDEKVLSFISYVSTATDAVLKAVEIFLEFPTVFGSTGPGLTDADGNPCPDCPCPGYEDVVFALKTQAA